MAYANTETYQKTKLYKILILWIININLMK